MKKLIREIACSIAALLIGSGVAQAADVVKIATVKSTALGAVYVALDKGYFKDAGIDIEFANFDSPGLVPPAIVSGSSDIGSTGVSAQLYALAAQGAVKIFAGQAREHATFQVNAFILSNAASAAGLTSLDKLAGHSIAISLIGSPVHYAAAQVLLKHGIALDQVRFLPVQSNGNIVSAVTGGTADTGVVPATVMAPALARGDLKLLAYIGDEVPWQIAYLLTSAKLADTQPKTVEHWLAAYRHAARDYHDAFTNAQGAREDQATAPEILAIMEKYLKQSAQRLEASIGYVDPEGRLDVPDVHHQAEWFAAQGLVKGKPDPDKIIASRYILPWTGVHGTGGSQ